MEEKRIRRPVNNPIVIEDAQEAFKQQEQASNVESMPLGYIEVKLDSLGKLDAPSVLHFRNYLMEEILELSTAIGNDEIYLATLIRCLNRMVYEKFDCSLLHEKELEEIQITLFAHFWGSKMEGKAYYKDPFITDPEKRDSEENIGYASLPISALKTIPLNKDFKEPIRITIADKAVRFRLPRVKDVLDAKEYINKKYFDQERKLSDVKAALDKKADVSYEAAKEYEEYIKAKNLDFIKAYQASILMSNGEQELNSLEDKMAAYGGIDLPYWKEYQKVVDEKLQFGIDPVVEFQAEGGEKLVRRFSFQSLDFLPTLELSADTDATVRFGA